MASLQRTRIQSQEARRINARASSPTLFLRFPRQQSPLLKMARAAASVAAGIGIGAAWGMRGPARAAVPVPETGPAPIAQVESQNIRPVLAVVRRGDTLWQLAVRYGSPDAPVQDTVFKIEAANQLGPDSSLIPGQEIRIPRDHRAQ